MSVPFRSNFDSLIASSGFYWFDTWREIIINSRLRVRLPQHNNFQYKHVKSQNKSKKTLQKCPHRQQYPLCQKNSRHLLLCQFLAECLHSLNGEKSLPGIICPCDPVELPFAQTSCRERYEQRHAMERTLKCVL